LKQPKSIYTGNLGIINAPDIWGQLPDNENAA
jgi:hypothetical protein